MNRAQNWKIENRRILSFFFNKWSVNQWGTTLSKNIDLQTQVLILQSKFYASPMKNINKWKIA